MIEASIVKINVKKSLPCARETSPFPRRNPNPVNVTIPIMIPAIPQAIATLIIFLAAVHITSTISFPPKDGFLPCARSEIETPSPTNTQATIPIKAANTAVLPEHKKKMITTKGRIIYPLRKTRGKKRGS